MDSAPLVPVTFDEAGAFTFSTALALNGAADGPHTVVFRATDRAGNVSTLPESFTLDTTPPTVTFDLDPASDTVPVGDHQTTLSTVILDGQTEPDLPVVLVQTGATTTSDALGHFSFSGVNLVPGANPLHGPGDRRGRQRGLVPADDHAGDAAAHLPLPGRLDGPADRRQPDRPGHGHPRGHRRGPPRGGFLPGHALAPVHCPLDPFEARVHLFRPLVRHDRRRPDQGRLRGRLRGQRRQPPGPPLRDGSRRFLQHLGDHAGRAGGRGLARAARPSTWICRASRRAPPGR